MYTYIRAKFYFLPQKCKVLRNLGGLKEKLQPAAQRQQVFSKPGTEGLDPKWVKVAVTELIVQQIHGTSGVLSTLHLPVCRPGLSISCHSRPHQQHVHITRLSAKQPMRLSSSLSIIFVSLFHLENILAQRNKETWARMAPRQAFTPVHGHKILNRCCSCHSPK